MMKKTLLALLVLLMGHALLAQDFSLYEKRMFINKGDTLRYRLLLPENYDPGKMYPMVLFLHGSGERGSDNTAQLAHGGELFLRDSIRKAYPAIIVFPQCPAQDTWADVTVSKDSTGKREFIFKAEGKPTPPMRLLKKLVKYLIAQYPITKRQVYVGGLSMGGMGTLEMLRRKDIGRGENFLAAQLADAGLIEPGLVALHLVRLALLHARLHQPPALLQVRAINLPRHRDQPRVLFRREFRQPRPVPRHALQQLRRGLDLRGHVGALIWRWVRVACGGGQFSGKFG